MLEILKKAVSFMDVLIIVLAGILLSYYDFDNLTTANKIFLGAFAIWILMLCVRIYIVYKGDKS